MTALHSPCMQDLLASTDFPQHVREALDAGKLWRAKEILRGRIGSLPFTPDLYEQYGVVLLAMQDELQAGKYLFLSGRRRAEYDNAIDIYLTRHGTRGGAALASSFPSRAQALPIDALPANVRDALVERGLSVKKAAKSLARAAVPVRTKLTSIAIGTGCILAIVLTTAALAAGIPIVLRTILEFFR